MWLNFPEAHFQSDWMTVVLHKSPLIKIDFRPASKTYLSQTYRNINTFHLHDFVKFCLCISLHVCVLVWLYHVESLKGLYVCVIGVCVCVFEESEQGFSALFWLLFHMGKKKVEQVLSSPKPVHRSCVQKKAAKKSRPQLPSPSASFRRFSSLHSVPRLPLFKLILLFIHPPFWLMLITLTPHVCWFARHKRKKRTPHYSATCLSCISVFS